MRFIPTLFHGVIDYTVGFIFILAPWLFGFSHVAWASWTIVGVGVLVLLQAALTDYEVGIIHKIPMKAHLMGDFGLGVILAVSPWMFNFADQVYLPHLIGGIFSILASLTTHRVPSESYRRTHPQHNTMR